jgi:alcohol dehydrogenase
MACLDPKAAARVAILDPELTVSQPDRVAACTGIDAVAHAVESAVSNRRNPISQAFSAQAFRLCSENLPKVFTAPSDIEARGQMQLGAAFAGSAIENSMLGAAHAAANPLTAHYGIVHGVAVGVMLPHVVRFNGWQAETESLYARLVGANGTAHANTLAQRIEELLKVAQMPSCLKELDVPEEAVEKLAEDAAKQWTAQFNPRPVGRGEFEKLYQSALNKSC